MVQTMGYLLVDAKYYGFPSSVQNPEERAEELWREELHSPDAEVGILSDGHEVVVWREG